MGRKQQNKKNSQSGKDNSTGKKLSAQKRNELNQLIDALLKQGFKQTNNVTEQWTQYLEIQAILDRIQNIENLLRIKGTGGGGGGLKSRTSALDDFTKWCTENGAKFNGVKVSEIPGFDLGLIANKNFVANELFITIPRKIIMSEEALSTSINPIVSEIPMFDSMTNVKLAFALILEKLNPESFWKPYVDVLPDRYSTVLYFNVNDMQELKGSNALSQALNQCKSIARQYAFIYKCVQNVRTNNAGGTTDKDKESSAGLKVFEMLKEKFTYDLYRWAVSTVMTRQNSVPRLNTDKGGSDGKDNDDVMPALIPLWDMANHKEGVVTSSYNLELDHLESVTLSEFKKGEQIFIYYGDRSNHDLLIHNGFVYPENKKDSVGIKFGLSSSDELLSERVQLLEQLKIPKNCELKVLPSPVFVSPQLLAFARIFNMNRDQLTHWINSDRAADLMHIDCALETSLETKTWIFLQTRLNLLLKVFPTTLEEDEIALSNHLQGKAKLGHIKAMLLQYRILEKKILKNAFEYIKLRTKL